MFCRQIAVVPSSGVDLSAKTSGSLLYVNSSKELAEDNANLFWDATNHYLGLGTAVPTARLDLLVAAVATAQTSGLIIKNTTAALVGAKVQNSPMLQLSGTGWKTDATAGSQVVDIALQLQPVTGEANPGGKLLIYNRINAGSWTANLTLGSTTLSGTPTAIGSLLALPAQTFTDNATLESAVAAAWSAVSIAAPTLAAVNPTVVTTSAATFYVAGPPTAGTNQTLTNAYPVLIDNAATSYNQLPGLALRNTTAATVLNSENSPLLQLTGTGLKTNAPAAAQVVDFGIQAQPVEGEAKPGGNLVIYNRVNGGAWTANLTLGSTTLSYAPDYIGSLLSLPAQTFTDNNTAAAGTAALWTGVTIAAPTLKAVNAITTTSAATFFIEGPPAQSTNQTITQGFAALFDRSSVGTAALPTVGLRNSTAATAGNQQYSPMLQLSGRGWKTNSTAGSQFCGWGIQLQPVQGEAAPGGKLAFLTSSDPTTWATNVTFGSGTLSGTPSATGSMVNIPAQTFTDNNTAGSGTAALWTGVSIAVPALAAVNTSVATTHAATFYVAGPPNAGTNQTLTNAHPALIENAGVAIGQLPGLTLRNPTAATNNNQKYSPMLVMTGYGWATSGGNSQSIDFAFQGQPAQGASNPDGIFKLLYRTAGGGWGNLTYWAIGAGLLQHNGLIKSALQVDATQVPGIHANNTANATVSVNQYSPMVQMTGTGWKTNATAGSQVVDFALQVQPTTGEANPGGKLIFYNRVNAGSWIVNLTLGSTAMSGTPSGTVGSLFALPAQTFTDNATANSGTAAAWSAFTIAIPTLTSVGTSVTTSDAATLYIAGPPTAGTNETLTRAHPLFIESSFAAGANVLPGITIKNSRTASNNNQVYSPTLTLTGSGYSAGVTTGLPISFALQTVPTQSTESTPYGKFSLYSSQNNGAFTERFCWGLEYPDSAEAFYWEMTETAAPTAPAANKVRVYCADSGGGKTKLMALFSSGVAQQLAIQP